MKNTLIALFLCSLILFFAAAHAEEEQVSRPITIVTWNIQVGSDAALNGNGWSKRKLALVPAIRAANPDVFCTQEGTLEQLKFIDKNFPKFGRVGVGRDDGKNKGEFCAIYYNKDLLQPLKSGTFWLSDTPTSPQTTWDPPYKRICTHVLFRNKVNETKFVVLSTHFPLNPLAQGKSAKLVIAEIQKSYEGVPTLLCGDFNCGPNSEAWKIFKTAFLEPIHEKHKKTYHVNGLATLCLDAIFKDEDTHVESQKVLTGKSKNGFPSDHFGLLAKVSIPDINQ